MIPIRTILTIRQGETWLHTFTVVDDDGAAVDVSGDAFEMDIGTAPNFGTITEVTTAVLDDGVTAGLKGQVRASLTAAQTLALYGYDGREAVFDLKRTAADGSVSFPFEGPVRIVESVTR